MPTIIDTTWQLVGVSVVGLAIMMIVVLLLSRVVATTVDLLRDAIAGITIGG
jgi:hypothetical protein